MMRKFPGLKEDHPLVGDECPVCNEKFKAGDEVTLQTLWPADKEQAKRAQDGRPYTAQAQPVHWTCRGDGTPGH